MINKIININYINIFLYLSWLAIISSLGTFPNINIEVINLNSLILFLRSNLIYTFVPLFILICFIKIKINILVSKYSFYFFLYVILQFLCLILSKKNSLYYDKYFFYFHFIYCPLITLFIISIALNVNKSVNYFLIIIIFVSAFIVTITIINTNKFLLNYNFIEPNMIVSKIFSISGMNSNGYGRYLTIVYAICLYAALEFYKKKWLFFFGISLISIYLGVNIFLLDGRSMILISAIITVIIFAIFFNQSLKIKIFGLLFYFLFMSIAINYSLKINEKEIQNLRVYYFQGEEIRNYNLKKEIRNYNLKNDNPNEITFLDKAENFSTGRITKWILLFEKSKKNYFQGYGPEFDRNLLNSDTKVPIGNDAANGFIYALISSGLLGVFFIILIKLHFFNLFRYFLKNKIKYMSDHLLKISFILSIFIFMRSIFESSYTSWNFDFLLLTITIIIIENKITKNKLDTFRVK
jgi:hypothetical protein